MSTIQPYHLLKKISVAILLFCLIRCTGKQPETKWLSANTTVINAPAKKDTFPEGKIIEHINCMENSAQSYTLYLPKDSNPLPILYFFDPHANGKLPLQQYKALADKYHFILVGSNNSQNGNDLSTAQTIWQYLYHDTQQRLNIQTNRIYVAGFSGGAKVAASIAMQNRVIKGVVLAGAGLPDGVAAGNFNFSITLLAGKGDMNMTELVSLHENMDHTSTQHRIVFFNGIHQWPPEIVMSAAFESLQLDAMRQNEALKDNLFINNFASLSRQNIHAAITQQNFTDAKDKCIFAINCLQQLSDTKWFEQTLNTIYSNALYKTQLLQQQKILQKEEDYKTIFQQQFQNGDMVYWAKTIHDVQSKANVQTAEGAMYQRLNAYLSLAFYSITNQMLNHNQNDAASYFDSLYKMAEPTNSEAFYFSAQLNARKNNVAGATNDLLQAVALGFNDAVRMRQQQEFQQTGINFILIESKMKGK